VQGVLSGGGAGENGGGWSDMEARVVEAARFGCRGLHRVCCSVLQCAAVCCSELQ